MRLLLSVGVLTGMLLGADELMAAGKTGRLGASPHVLGVAPSDIQPFRRNTLGAPSSRLKVDGVLGFDLNRAGLDRASRRKSFRALTKAQREDIRAGCAVLGEGGVGDDIETARERAFCKAIR
jgi:hypothetical protein